MMVISDSQDEVSNFHDLLALGEMRKALELDGLSKKSKMGRESEHDAWKKSQEKEVDGIDMKRGGDVSLRLIQKEQVLRLPLLLRYLSILQPLASVPSISFASDDGNDGENGNDKNISDDEMEYQMEVNTVVALLEKVAVSYPAAEGVDILTYYLAPEVCRKISKCSALTRKRKISSSQHANEKPKSEEKNDNRDRPQSEDASNYNGSNNGNDNGDNKKKNAEQFIIGTLWDTTSLENISQNKRGRNIALEHSEDQQNIKDNMDGFQNDNDKIEDEDNSRPKRESLKKSLLPVSPDASPLKKRKQSAETSPNKKRKADGNKSAILSNTPSLFSAAQESSSAAAEDSQESTVGQILAEIISLILTGLEPIKLRYSHPRRNSESINISPTTQRDREKLKNDDAKDNENENKAEDETEDDDVSGVIISVKPDSLLAEPPVASGSNGNAGSWNSGNDLGAIISVLLHHAPVLRYEHLANALCRSAIPQCSAIITRMAANCPASIACIVNGCIKAFEVATALQLSHPRENSMTRSSHSIVKCCKSSLKGISKLSQRESSLVCNALMENGNNLGIKIPDILLEIMIDSDREGSIMILLKELSSFFQKKYLKSDTKQSSDKDQYSRIAPKRNSERHFKRKRIRRSNVSSTSEMFIQSSNKKMSMLSKLLLTDKNLASSARKCILSCLESFIEKEKLSTNQNISWGEASLYLQTFSILIYHTGIGAGSSYGSGSAFVESSMNAVASIVNNLSRQHQDGTSGITQSCSSRDEAFKFAFCACIATCYSFAPIADAKGHFMGGPAMVACASCLSNLLNPNKIDGISEQTNVFVSRIVGSISSEDATELRNLFLSYIVPDWNNEIGENNELDGQLNAFFNFCRWCSSKNDTDDLSRIENQGLSLAAICVDISGAVDAFRRCRLTDGKMDTLLSKILTNSEICGKIYVQESTVDFIRYAVKILENRSEPLIPIVLPLKLDELGRKVNWNGVCVINNKNKDNDDMNTACQFVLQLLYSFTFLENHASSPFSIDPRTLPICEALRFAKNSASIPNRRGTVFETLQQYTYMFCPEISDIFNDFQESSRKVGLSSSSVILSNATPSMVCDAIRWTIFDKQSTDEGYRAKKLFISSLEMNSFTKVDIEATRALLSERNRPSPSFSYSLLCEDPLILLKCHASTWRIHGLRFIIISVLSRSLRANEEMIMRNGQTEDVSNELLAARDCLVSRCLITIGSGDYFRKHSNQTLKSLYCPMIVNLLRSLIKKQRGLVAMLIKQGLSDCMVDWLIECVPECSLDAQVLTSYLSFRTMKATERLSTADASLRIAIVHGSKDAYECQKLAYAALSVLVSSFFLVLGPVGVAVNMMCEESGQDVTQKCRRSTFRMLSALQSVKSDEHGFIKEAKMALAKIATLCKGDNLTGLSTGVATMRRKILQEIYDSCVRAINSMGGGVQI